MKVIHKDEVFEFTGEYDYYDVFDKLIDEGIIEKYGTYYGIDFYCYINGDSIGNDNDGAELMVKEMVGKKYIEITEVEL